MKPEDDRCEKHGLYLYRTGFGWSCKLGCYYTDDTQKIKDGFIAQYKEELKDKINKKLNEFAKTTDIDGRETLYKYTDCDLADLRAEILELLE